MIGDVIHVEGRPFVVTDEAIVTVDYYKTVRRHGVDVREYSPYSYTAVSVKSLQEETHVRR